MRTKNRRSHPAPPQTVKITTVLSLRDPEGVVAISQNHLASCMYSGEYETFSIRLHPMFRKDPSFKNYIWDVLAAAVAIDPSVILESETLPIDVDDQYGYGYGQTMGFRGAAPEGAQNAKIVYAVDRAKIWKMVEDVFNKL